MKKFKIKLAVAAVLGVLSITPAMSAQLVLDSTGKVLMGINGVQVGTSFYNVLFGDTDTTAADIFAFTSFSEASAATRELFKQLDVGGLAGGYGDGASIANGNRINGTVGAATFFDHYYIFTHYGAGAFVFDYDYNQNNFGGIKSGGGRLTYNGAPASNYQRDSLFDANSTMRAYTDYTNAVWMTAADVMNEVPEPTSITLLGLGAIGYAASRRKLKNPTQTDTMPTTA